MNEPRSPKVKELKLREPGEPFEGWFILKSRSVKTAKNGNPFLMAEFCDRTGGFSCTLFSDGAAYSAIESSADGAVFRICGKVDRYNDKFSPKILGADPMVPGCEGEAAILGALVESAPEDAEAMWSEFQTHVAGIGHAGLRATVEAVFAEIGEPFRSSHAAVSMHHAYRSGLLEHTLHLARACRALLPLYPEVDPSLAMAGVLLHDIGKVSEYTQGGLSAKRTRAGMLQGHVVLGYAMARKHGLRTKLEASLLERLEHVILSHQGRPEWGAAVMAATPEAVFVSLVDNFDAKMGMVQKALRDAVEGVEFSERIAGLESSLLLSPVELAERP